MVPIGDTFLRFKRVVRDTAKELAKEIELVIEGADTELDRSMVENSTTLSCILCAMPWTTA